MGSWTAAKRRMGLKGQPGASGMGVVRMKVIADLMWDFKVWVWEVLRACVVRSEEKSQIWDSVVRERSVKRIVKGSEAVDTGELTLFSWDKVLKG
jgi:hypothetical protein